jgi:hypothetical protein
MFNANVTVLTTTINRIILLMQIEQNAYLRAPDSITKSIAGAKVEAYQESINALQSTLEEVYGK